MHASHASAPPIAAEQLLRFALYEYEHGNAPLVRHLIDTLVSGPDQTSR